MVDELTALPNIGTVLARKLHEVGIHTYEDLTNLGSVEAYLRIWDHEGTIGYNMLYALEGAIQGLRWLALTAEQRQAVKTELLKAMRRAGTGTQA